LCTQVVEEEGVAALFKGAAERVMRSSPQFGAACVCVHAHVFMPWRTRSYEVLSFDQTGVTLCAFSALKDASIERGWLQPRLNYRGTAPRPVRARGRGAEKRVA